MLAKRTPRSPFGRPPCQCARPKPVAAPWITKNRPCPLRPGHANTVPRHMVSSATALIADPAKEPCEGELVPKHDAVRALKNGSRGKPSQHDKSKDQTE